MGPSFGRPTAPSRRRDHQAPSPSPPRASVVGALREALRGAGATPGQVPRDKAQSACHLDEIGSAAPYLSGLSAPARQTPGNGRADFGLAATKSSPSRPAIVAATCDCV